MVISTDFYPTMLEMAGLPLKPEQHQDGVSILPLLTGKSQSLDRDTLYWHYPHYHRTLPYGAIRQGDWKLIEFFEKGTLELFNLKTDPFEKNNLIENNPEKAQALLKISLAGESLSARRCPQKIPITTPTSQGGKSGEKTHRKQTIEP